MKSVCKLYTLPLCVLTILGCNTEQSAKDSTQPYAELNAIDAFEIITPDVENRLKLTPHISGSNVNLTAIERLNDACPDVVISGQTALLSDMPAGQLCHYLYRVSDESNQTKAANLTLFSTSLDEDAIIAPLSLIMTVGDARQTLDLQALHGSNWPTGYQLDGSSLTVIGENGGLGIPEYAGGNSIAYTPAVISGWNQITFVATDSNDPLAKKIGSIFITISEQENSAPDIQPKHYVYNDYNNQVIAQSTPSVIDLTNLMGLTIQDTDAQDTGAWLIESVLSYTADVEINATNNKSIDFTASNIGKHDISYVVSDGFGGYAHGSMTIDVAPREQARTWDDIDDSYQGIEYTFLAPLLYSEAAPIFNVSPLWDANIENTLAGFDSGLAEAFCSSMGRLPTVTEAKRLKERGGNGIITGFASWPKTHLYLVTADDGSGPAAFDMNTEALSALSGDKEYIASCVSTSMFAIDMVNYQAVADGQPQIVAHVSHTAGAVITTTFLSDTINESSDGVTVDVSNGVLSVTGTKSGYFQIEVTEEMAGKQTTLRTPRLQFVAGAVTTISVSSNPDDQDEDGVTYLMADGIDQLTIMAQASDVNANIAVDALMFYSENASSAGSLVSVDSNIALTDDQGQATFVLTGDINESFADGTYSKTYHYDLTADGQTTPFSFTLKHANYYDVIELVTYPQEGFVIPAKIRVLNKNGIPRAATIIVSGGIRGSILHAGDNGVYSEKNVLQEINIPVEGADVWVTMAVSNVQGEYSFDLTGSPSEGVITIPAEVKDVNTLEINSEAYLGTLTADEVRGFIAEYNVFEMLRGSRESTRVGYLPNLDLASRGKVITLINAALNNFTLYTNETTGEHETIPAVNWNAKSCTVASFYWDGEKWFRLAASVVPHPTIFYNNCRNSDIYLEE